VDPDFRIPGIGSLRHLNPGRDGVDVMRRARDPATTAADRTVPELDPGLTVLETPDHRSGALYRVALRTIRRADGRTYWIDARNTASTYALREAAPDDCLLDRLRIARAFTAYQHLTLVERVLDRVSPRTGCVVAPNLASLYRDDDVPGHETVPLLEAAASALAELAADDLPVLATLGGPDDDLADAVSTHADAEFACERTEMGYRFEGTDFETDVYWAEDWWQTTIPYWVDLLGVASERPDRPLTGPRLRYATEG
jgi:hypothetical protein